MRRACSSAVKLAFVDSDTNLIRSETLTSLVLPAVAVCLGQRALLNFFLAEVTKSVVWERRTRDPLKHHNWKNLKLTCIERLYARPHGE